MQNKLKGKKGKRKRSAPTLCERKYTWATKITNQQNLAYEQTTFPTPESRKKETNKRIKEYFETKWKEKWNTHCTAPRRNLSVIRTIDQKLTGPKIHEGLDKAESTLATQVRTEVIGLANFLYRMRVSGVTTLACGCGYQRQTAKHVIMNCPEHADSRNNLKASTEHIDCRELAGTPKRLKRITKWLMLTNLLTQFSWSADCLYPPSSMTDKLPIPCTLRTNRRWLQSAGDPARSGSQGGEGQRTGVFLPIQGFPLYLVNIDIPHKST